MPGVLEVIFATALMIAAAVWIGGYVAVVVVSVVSSRELEGEARVRFFRGFGKAYFKVSVPALLIAYGTGWTFLSRLSWSGELTLMAMTSFLLLAVLLAGVIQARDLTRLRERLSAGSSGTEGLAQTIRQRARAAAVLRGLIGLLTLGITVQAAILLVDAV